MNMERRDLLAAGASILIPLLAGIAAAGIQSQRMVVQIVVWGTYATSAAIVISVAAIYKAREMYGGEVARNLELIAMGYILFIVSFLPHTLWHVSGLPDALGPGWAIFSQAWWTGFFHIGAIMFFMISVYGFYKFWEA